MLCNQRRPRCSCLLASSALFLPTPLPYLISLGPPSPQCRTSNHCGLCDDDHCIRHTLTRTARCFRFRFAKKMLNPIVRTRPVTPHGREKDGMIVHHLLVPHFRAPVSRLFQTARVDLADQQFVNFAKLQQSTYSSFRFRQILAHSRAPLPTLTWPDLLGPEKWMLTDSDSTAAAEHTQRCAVIVDLAGFLGRRQSACPSSQPPRVRRHSLPQAG